MVLIENRAGKEMEYKDERVAFNVLLPLSEEHLEVLTPCLAFLGHIPFGVCCCSLPSPDLVSQKFLGYLMPYCSCYFLQPASANIEVPSL